MASKSNVDGDSSVVFGNVQDQNELTCGTVVEIYNSSSDFAQCLATLKSKYPLMRWEISSELSIRMKLQRLIDNIKQHRRNHKTAQIDVILKKSFELPTQKHQIQQETVNKLTDDTKHAIAENHSLKREILQHSNENETLQVTLATLERRSDVIMELMKITMEKHEDCLKAYKSDTVTLAEETRQWQQKYEMIERKLDNVNEEREKLTKKLTHSSVRSLTKRLKTRDNKIVGQQAAIAEHKATNKQLLSQVQEAEQEIEEMKTSIDAKSRQLETLRKQRCALQKKLSAAKKTKCIEVDINNQQILELSMQILNNEKQIAQLQQMNELLESNCISTFANGKYTNEVRQCIMTLMTECNISVNKMSHVIRTVLSKLGNKQPERLPSKALLSRFTIEAKILASKQVAQAMIEGSDIEKLEGNCLHADGTTKSHRTYEGFQVSLPSGSTMSFGLKEVGRENTTTLLETLKESLGDLAEAISTDDEQSRANMEKLVVSILTMMTDGAAVNQSVATEFEAFRSKLLPSVIDEWDNFSPDVKMLIKSLSLFYCKIHLLVNMADSSDTVLSSYESNVVTGGNPFSFGKGGSGTHRLIRTAAKLLTARGSDKAGVYQHWAAYLRDKDENDHLVSFFGNRFNIVFFEAAAFYHHRKDIEDFLNKFIDLNQLAQSVLFDTREKVYIGGVRALGIVGKLITSPYERLLTSVKTLLELNPYLLHMQQQLETWSENASPLMTGNERLFDDVPVTKDAIFDSLFADTDDPMLDTLTQLALELVLKSMLILVERRCADNLPGGKYWEPSPQIIKKASNVPPTNVVAERDMGILDYLKRLKPSAHTIGIEATVMWLNNKTSAWLSSVSDAERDAMIDDARRKGKSTYDKFKEREQKLKQQHMDAWREKQDLKVRKADKDHAEMVSLTQELTALGGLWTSGNIDSQLIEVSRKAKHCQVDRVKQTALVTQISYHRKVLKSTGKRELFQKSIQRRVYTVDELADNLRVILRLNTVREPSSFGLQYRAIPDVQEAIADKKGELVQKLVDARNKRRTGQQKTLLPKLIANPSLLTHHRIIHFVRDPGQPAQWFDAYVLSCCVNPNPSKSKYTVRYDVAAEDTYTFELLLDLEQGQLVICDM